MDVIAGPEIAKSFNTNRQRSSFAALTALDLTDFGHLQEMMIVLEWLGLVRSYFSGQAIAL